jgi:NADH dehydrogenase FAD-containing subunit
VERLSKKAGVRWLSQSTAALDVNARTLQLADGSTFGFDCLSVNTVPMQDRQQIEAVLPGAREHGLFVRPLEAFGALWPRVAALGTERALRVAILGADATGIELAMAIRQRLPSSPVTLVSGESKVAAGYPAGVQQRVLKALKHRRITLLPDLAVRIQAGQVLLDSGARLACDVPVIAAGVQPPAWLSRSGLALDERGYVAVDEFQRSVSHRHVFAAAGVTERADRTLAKNLYAQLMGSPERRNAPALNTLQWLSCGDRRAIANWGNFSVQGRSVWWLKNWLDRGFIKHYRRD